MTKPFDPYHTWLGIRPEEQPPSHYRLLALHPFEDNADTIEHAADQRMAHLRTLQAGRHSMQCQQLLNEVAAAKVCLLNADRKAAYDAALRGHAAAPVSVVAMAPPPVATPMPSVAHAAATPVVRSYPRRRRHSTLGTGLVLGGVAVVAALVLLLWAPCARPAATSRPRRSSNNPTANRLTASRGPNLSRRSSLSSQARLRPRSRSRRPSRRNRPSSRRPATRPLCRRPIRRQLRPRRPIHPLTRRAPEAPAKLAVPAATEQQAVAAQIEDVYKLSQAKTAADKVKLARELSDLARKATQNTAERFVLRRKAMELAADGGELRLAFDAIETIGSEFQIDVLSAKETVLAKFAEKASEPDRAKAAVQQALELVDEALREKRYELAHKAATAAVRAAQRTGTPPELRKQAVERRTKVQKLFEQWQQVEQAEAALVANPADAEANLALGHWKCLVEGDWSAGVALLAKGSDATLKAAAAQEQTGGSDAAILLKRGDAWWDAAQAFAGEEKAAWLRRTAHWYQQMASRESSPLEQAKATKRLDEIAAFQESLVPAEKPPEKIVAKKPGERQHFTPQDVMKQFGLAASQWKVEDDVLRSEGGAMRGDASFPITTRVRKVNSFAYGLKMKARDQTIYVVVDGHRYSYARGVRLLYHEGWDRRDEMPPPPWSLTARRANAARGSASMGRARSHRGEQIADRDDFCTLAVTLKDNGLRFLYADKEVWTGQIATVGRGTKHTCNSASARPRATSRSRSCTLRESSGEARETRRGRRAEKYKVREYERRRPAVTSCALRILVLPYYAFRRVFPLRVFPLRVFPLRVFPLRVFPLRVSASRCLRVYPHARAGSAWIGLSM